MECICGIAVAMEVQISIEMLRVFRQPGAGQFCTYAEAARVGIRTASGAHEASVQACQGTGCSLTIPQKAARGRLVRREGLGAG